MAAATAVDPALWTEAFHGRNEGVSQLLAEGAEIEEPGGGEFECPPLQAAAFCGHSSTVLLLLEHGAGVSTKSKDGGTALMFACLGGHPEVASLLLSKGAEVTAKDNCGRTALHAAASLASLGRQNVALLLVLLLSNHAEVSAKDVGGGTPLHYAASQGNTELSQLLLANGADVLSKSDAGETAEDIATASSHPQVAAMLKAEAERRAQCEAFAMGQQERLGAGSRVQWLDPGVVLMVLEQV